MCARTIDRHRARPQRTWKPAVGIAKRGESAGPAEGDGRLQGLDAPEDAGDVVGAPASLAARSRRSTALSRSGSSERSRHQRIRDHARETVGAEQIDVVAAASTCVSTHRLFHSEGADDDVLLLEATDLSPESRFILM